MFTIPVISKGWRELLENFRNRGFSGKDVRFGLREEKGTFIINFSTKLFQEIKAANEKVGLQSSYLVKLFSKKPDMWKKVNEDRCEFIAKGFTDLFAFQLAISITLVNYDPEKIGHIRSMGKITKEIKDFLLNEIKKSPGEISLHELIDIFTTRLGVATQEEHIQPNDNAKDQEKSARIFREKEVISRMARKVLEEFFTEGELKLIKIGTYYKKGLYYLNVSFSQMKRSVKKKQLPLCLEFCSENTEGLIQGLKDLLSGWKERGA